MYTIRFEKNHVDYGVPADLDTAMAAVLPPLPLEETGEEEEEVFPVSFCRLTQHRMLTQAKAHEPTYTTRNLGGTSRKLTVCAGSQNRQDRAKVGTNFCLHSSTMLGWRSIRAIPGKRGRMLILDFMLPVERSNNVDVRDDFLRKF